MLRTARSPRPSTLITRDSRASRPPLPAVLGVRLGEGPEVRDEGLELLHPRVERFVPWPSLAHEAQEPALPHAAEDDPQEIAIRALSQPLPVLPIDDPGQLSCAEGLVRLQVRDRQPGEPREVRAVAGFWDGGLRGGSGSSGEVR